MMKHAIRNAGCLTVALLAWGCASTKDPDPQTLPSQTLLPENARTSEVRPAAPPKPPEETLIVIEPGTAEDPHRGIVEASRAERIRRQEIDAPSIVLTDKNLEEYQKGAQLTFVHEDESAQTTDSPTAPSDDLGDLPTSEVGEQYWRDRGRQIRLGWRDSIDRIEELQGDVAEYRRRFYEEDDPSIRETMVKPAWDRALEELDEARVEASRLEEDLQKYLNLGYESGAYDEWLDEGIELEPTDDELEQLARSRNTIQFDEPNIAPEDFDNRDLP